MRTKLTTAMLAMAGAVYAAAAPPSYSSYKTLCEGTEKQDKGNLYCQKVQRIAYQNVGKGGSYDYEEVVSMDQETGDCKFAPAVFSGPLAPFNSPVSPVS